MTASVTATIAKRKPPKTKGPRCSHGWGGVNLVVFHDGKGLQCVIRETPSEAARYALALREFAVARGRVDVETVTP